MTNGEGGWSQTLSHELREFTRILQLLSLVLAPVVTTRTKFGVGRVPSGKFKE